jgi:uncharacterized membrane protein
MDVIFYIGFAVFILFGPWILLWRVNSRRKGDRLEDQSRWADLTSRVHALERELKKFRTEGAVTVNEAAAKQLVVEPSISREVKPVPASSPKPSQVVEPHVRQAQPTPQSWPTSSADVSTAKTLPSGPRMPSTAERPSTPAPSFPEPIIAPSLFERFRSSLDIEEMLGTDWLNKLGIVLLVLGIAFFLAYQLRTMGPAGKVSVGFATAAVMLGAGIWAERKDRYRILARAGIGGGWALLFFTTYAMYHVPAAHVLESQLTDLVLMLAVAAAMVLHTLRYQSQVVTGLAFLLAFLTVTISHSNVYSLSAGAVLAAGLVVIVGRTQWFELEVFGIAASYLNHYLWLRPIIEPMEGKHHPFPEFTPSAGILILYWLVFRLSYVFRTPTDEAQERISTAAALLNASLLLALLKYQSVHPEWAFWALLAMGAMETGFGLLPATRRRRNAVIVLTTIGTVLLIAAFPFRYSGTRLSVLWLAEAEALLLIGVWTKEIIYRRLGTMASVLVAGQMIAYDAAEIFGRRMDDADLRADFPVSTLFIVAAAVFYLNAHWVLPRWSELFSAEFDETVMKRLSYAGMVMMLIALWIAFPQAWTAVAWCALALAATLAAGWLEAPDFGYQAIFLAAISVVRVLAINLTATDKFHGLSLRLVTTSLVSVLLYVTACWSAKHSSDEWRFGSIARDAYTWAASFLLALLAWYELQPVGVADAWMIGGLILLELGLKRRNVNLRLQGYVALLATFSRIFFVNLNANGAPGEVSPRFYTVVPIALGFFYAYGRLHAGETELARYERKFRVTDLYCWLGTISIGSLMRFELEPDWVAAAWAALVLALSLIAWRSAKKVFLYQALFVTSGVLFRTVLHNFYERTYFPAPFWESRWVTVGATIVLLLLCLPVAFQVRNKEVSDETGLVALVQNIVRRPEQIFFFIAVGLLTVLLSIEMRHGMVTLSWGLEGLAVFVIALWLGERSFRLTGFGLLLLCVGKILVEDVWRLNPRDRYLTFIVLGGSLLLVSFLYTRNREAIRRYL